MTRGAMLGTFDINKLRLWDLNEKLMIADNSLIFELLAKGVQWPSSKPIKENEDYRKISPYHGFVINWAIDDVSPTQSMDSLREVSRFHDQIEDVFIHSP